MRPKIAMTFCCCALLLDCTATETGNPVSEQHLALMARSSADDITVGAATTTPHTRVKQAWVVLGDMRFVQAAHCEDKPSATADVDGPITVELVWKPKSIDFAVEDTDYCRVRFPLREAKAPLGDAPAELEAHSILITGERVDKTPFNVRSKLTTEADVRSPTDKPFPLSKATSDLILAFDLGRWLEGIDFDSLKPGADGAIWIDEDHETDQLAIFEKNVNVSLGLYRDQNADGTLSASEAKTPLASGK
jgi:hypothetical protein